MKIVFSEECLGFGKSGHPESPGRVRKASEFLREKGYSSVEPEPCVRDDLLQVHDESLVRKVEDGDFYNPDSPTYDGIYDYARLAVGGALKASEINGFSIMRPPGHHATTNKLGGFCYFNNIAVAVEKLGKRTLIVDIDRHHGNGTQDIFKGSGKTEYVSLHSVGYPGTGMESSGNVHNHTFRSRTGDGTYLEALDGILGEVENDFELLAVSAGFDGYRKDPLSSYLELSTEGYRRIGERLSKLDLPAFCVLEGGYNAEDLGENIHSFLQGLEL